MVVGDEQLMRLEQLEQSLVDVYSEPECIGGNEVGQCRYPRLSYLYKNPVPYIRQGSQTAH